MPACAAQIHPNPIHGQMRRTATISLSLYMYIFISQAIPSISMPSIDSSRRILDWMRNSTKKTAALVVCLQAQHVAGLPAAAEGRQVLLRLLQQQQAAAAAATCREGVAAFHDQVLLLDCAPVSSMDDLAVAVAVTVDDSTRAAAAVDVNLAEQLRRPSPRVLRFVLGGGAGRTSTAGAVLCLTLHHRRLMTRRRSGSAVGGCTAALLSCLRASLPPAPGGPPEEAGGNGVDDDDDESSGFITIEKGTISRRRPPSDNLVTTDDEQGPTSATVKEEDSKVENEFLAMLELEGDDLDLDALIKDTEAELARKL